MRRTPRPRARARSAPATVRAAFTFLEVLIALLILGLIGIEALRAQTGVLRATAAVRAREAGGLVLTRLVTAAYLGQDAAGVKTDEDWTVTRQPIAPADHGPSWERLTAMPTGQPTLATVAYVRAAGAQRSALDKSAASPVPPGSPSLP